MYRRGTLTEVTLKWAQTIDGQLADDSDQSQWISGIEERSYTYRVSSGFLLKNVDRFQLDSKEQLGADILLRYKVRNVTSLKQVMI